MGRKKAELKIQTNVEKLIDANLTEQNQNMLYTVNQSENTIIESNLEDDVQTFIQDEMKGKMIRLLHEIDDSVGALSRLMKFVIAYQRDLAQKLQSIQCDLAKFGFILDGQTLPPVIEPTIEAVQKI